jgi:hypothetical protein
MAFEMEAGPAPRSLALCVNKKGAALSSQGLLRNYFGSPLAPRTRNGSPKITSPCKFTPALAADVSEVMLRKPQPHYENENKDQRRFDQEEYLCLTLCGKEL